MSMYRKKTPKIINEVLYVREQERLADILQNNKFSVFIDESFGITNDKWLTIFVRYVDSQTFDVRTELLELIQLDTSDCTDEELFKIFEDTMLEKQIPFQNILALSFHNVMTERYEFFITKLKKYCENLITIPCPHYTSILIINEACEVIPEICEEFLQIVASFIASSPKRVCNFQELFFYFNDDRKNLKLSETRWLSRYSCVAKLNKNWDKLLNFLQEELNKNKKLKSEAILLSMMEDPEIQAYFLFLEYILDIFNDFNASFETQKTKVHLLQSAAENLLKIILRNIVKVPILRSTVNVYSILDPLLECNRRSPDKVKVGQACQNFLDQLNQEGQSEIVKSIYANCLSFYNIAAKEIRHKLYVNDEFLKKLKIFVPKFALQQENEESRSNESIQDVLFVAKRFGEFDEKMLRREWHLLPLDFTPEQKAEIILLDFDDAWKEILTIKKANGTYKYPTIIKLVNAIRSLPNSNADAEKIFSIMTDMKRNNRNKLNPINVQAVCVFKSSLRARKETALTMEVDARHLSLMSYENLFRQQTNVKKAKRKKLRSSAADECPSTSSDLN